MTTSSDPAGGGQTAGGAPTEEELRAAYEAEIKKLRIEHLLLEHVVTLINLGSRRTGQAPGTEDERDPQQVRLAIESIRVLMPLLEQVAPQQAGPIREALSQLQLAYVKIGGQQAPAGAEQAAGASGGGGAGGGVGGGGPGSGGGDGGDGGGVGDSGGAQEAGEQPGQASEAAGEEGKPAPDASQSEQGQPGPAQRSGRLWVPGQ